MTIPDDFVDMAVALVDAEARFLVVGAHALAVHGQPRATADIDFWVEPAEDNSLRVLQALANFGAPVAAHGISAEDFARPGMVYQIGLPPLRIDLLTAIDGVEFHEAYGAGVEGQLGSAAVRFLSAAHMLQNKVAAGRPKDLADAVVLREILSRR